MKTKKKATKEKEKKEVEKTFSEIDRPRWYLNKNFYMITFFLLIFCLGGYSYYLYKIDKAIDYQALLSLAMKPWFSISIGILLLLVPLSMTILTIHSFRKDMLRMLKYFGKSIPVYFAIFIFIALIMYVFDFMIHEAFINDRKGLIVQLAALSIALVITIIFAIRSYIKNFYTDFKLSTLFIPVVVILMFKPVINLVGQSNFLYVWIVYGIFFLTATILSLVFIMVYSRDRNLQLFWTTVLYILYSILLPVGLFIRQNGDMFSNETMVLSFIILSLLVPINFLINSMDLIRIRSRTAIATIFIAFVSLSPLYSIIQSYLNLTIF